MAKEATRSLRIFKLSSNQPRYSSRSYPRSWFWGRRVEQSVFAMAVKTAGWVASSSLVYAQTLAPPQVSYDPLNQVLRLSWESAEKQTFFPQISTDLKNWSYADALHFGTGPHVREMTATAPKSFYRLASSSLPVASKTEAEMADFDLDSISNIEELTIRHTDPLNPDSDRDGLPDGWEVAHGISPLDDGTMNPVNGPNGLFGAGSSSLSGRGLTSATMTTNAMAYGAGVTADPASTLLDLDGDGIPNDRDAGPRSKAINWEATDTPAKFIFVPLPGHNLLVHGHALGCNDLGDLVTTKALYSNGSWKILPEFPNGPANPLPIKMRFGGEVHDVYVSPQGQPDSVADDGRIVGSVGVSPLTRLACIWDSWAAAPRLLAHAPGTVLDGYDWDERGRISSDGVIVIDRNANTHRQGSDRTLIRYAADGSQSSISFMMGPRPKIGRGGFYAFETLDRNAYHWLPNAPLASVYPNSTFSTPNPRNFFYYWGDRFYVGERPGLGLGDGFCINFWEKVMIFHQGRWLEAQEMGDATHVTKKGVAFRGRNSRAVEVWNEGNSSQTLNDAVLNKNFSDLSTSPIDSTSDGRVLIEYSHWTGGVYEYGWLLPVEVAVDADRDGEITFNQKDKTTAEKPFRFWINDDVDKGNTVDGNDYEEDDLNESAKDSEDGKLNFCRDLEDLTRLWIDFSGINSVFPASDPSVALKVRIEADAGSPVINLYQPVETDGGREYLKDENTGYNQLQGIYGQQLCQVTSAATVVPRRAWETLPSDKVVHLLFEGATEGDGKLIFEIWKDGEKKCDLPPVLLSLKKAKDMYETWTVGDVDAGGVNFTKWPAASATQTSGQNIPAPEKPEEKDYIMFVHGWNMPPWEKETFASTMFKRMWHQGFKGRFGAFRWPTFYGLSGPSWGNLKGENIHTAHFDGSEQRAWNSASALKNLLINRESEFGTNKLRLYAHSMGNIVSSEALRQMAPSSHVNTYVSAQAAVSSHVWDNTTPRMTFNAPLGLNTPNVYGYYWQSTAALPPHNWENEGRPSYMYPQYMPPGTTYINHYNPLDWALSYDNWQLNQVLKPDVDYNYGWPALDFIDISLRFWKTQSIPPFRNLTFPNDRFEVFSYAAQSHGYATGQQGATGGMFNVARSVNLLLDYQFESAHKGHSAQFRSTIQKRWTYWRKAMEDMKINLPTP